MIHFQLCSKLIENLCVRGNRKIGIPCATCLSRSCGHLESSRLTVFHPLAYRHNMRGDSLRLLRCQECHRYHHQCQCRQECHHCHHHCHCCQECHHCHHLYPRSLGYHPHQNRSHFHSSQCQFDHHDPPIL